MLTNTLEPERTTAAEPPIRIKRKLLNSLISSGSFQDFVNQVFWLTENKTSSYVCFANVHMLMEAKQDAAFSEVLNNADLAAPDGGPVSKLMKLLYGEEQDRVPGMDLLPRLLQEAQARGKSVFFYGSTDDVLQAVAARANADLPDLRIAGTYSPPFRQLSEEEDQEIIRMINNAGADLVFVALGCPKQERWMADHKGKVNACMLGVGQAYMTYAGLERRLPQWARDLSLEWTYRLWQEPRRLWKRYLLTNSMFMFEVMKLLANGKGRHSEISN